MVSVKLIIFVVLSSYIGLKVFNFCKPSPKPEINENAYWGRGSKDAYKEDATIKAFTVKYPTEVIKDLEAALSVPQILHDPLEGIDNEYGLNSKTLIRFIDYWRDEYLPRWSERQKLLNSFPQFTTQIDGLNIHYIHVKPAKTNGKTIVPLLLLHGWPGSIREFYDFIPLLTDSSNKNDVVYEVIAPSLPGFGWSDGAAKPGFGPAEISVVLNKLMLRLNHKKYLIQGGDFGSIIGSNIATLFPQNIIGYHSNFCVIRTGQSTLKLLIASIYPKYFIEEKYVSYVFPAGAKFIEFLKETGYFHIQATKPDTIGAVLTKNPIGLAAYFLEKVITFYPHYEQDGFLDNIMIYYLTNSITTSFRLYAESMSKKQSSLNIPRVQTDVPTACARFANDISYNFDWQLKDKYTNLIQSTWYDVGSHFAAMDVPKVLFADLTSFVKKIGKIEMN